MAASKTRIVSVAICTTIIAATGAWCVLNYRQVPFDPQRWQSAAVTYDYDARYDMIEDAIATVKRIQVPSKSNVLEILGRPSNDPASRKLRYYLRRGPFGPIRSRGWNLDIWFDEQDMLFDMRRVPE